MPSESGVPPVRLTDSGRVAKGKCLVHTITITAQQGGKQVWLYDSQEEDAQQIVFHYRSPEEGSFAFSWGPALELQRGVYVKFESDKVDSVTLQVEQLEG